MSLDWNRNEKKNLQKRRAINQKVQTSSIENIKSIINIKIKLYLNYEKPKENTTGRSLILRKMM